MQSPNAITWFAMTWSGRPVTDMSRAGRFYAQVLGKPLEKQSFGPHELLVFPYRQPGVGGCLMSYKPLQPGVTGTAVYLAVSDTLDAALNRVTRAGGEVALGRTELPGDIGYYAHIIDSEGNRVGLHAAS
jgi:predicted enzyme related to lactoylglutathione lyase